MRTFWEPALVLEEIMAVVEPAAAEITKARVSAQSPWLTRQEASHMPFHERDRVAVYTLSPMTLKSLNSFSPR